MDRASLNTLQNRFDTLSHTVPDEGIQFWFDRVLMETRGYVRWESGRTESSKLALHGFS